MKIFDLDLITFDSLHTINNCLKPFYLKIINKIMIPDFSQLIKTLTFDLDLLNINKYNMIIQNHILLDLFPLLLLEYKKDKIYNTMFNLLDVINNCLFYDYSNYTIYELNEKLLDTLIILEHNFNFTPSMHSIVHMVKYLQDIGPLYRVSTCPFERSYKPIKHLTKSNKNIMFSILKKISLINHLKLFTYEENKYKNKAKLNKNNSTTIENIYNTYNDCIFSFYFNDSISFGICTDADESSISYHPIQINKITIKIYKIIKIEEEIKRIDRTSINTKNYIYKNNNEYFLTISDFLYQ